MNKTKQTFANAVFQIVSIIVQSLLVLIVTREIIATIGSDYNGITSTATQLLTFLTLIEGGFTLATLVKLYKPYGENDLVTVNKYLALSREKFHKIGWLYLGVGIIITAIYTPLVKTEATYLETASIIGLSVVSSAFSIYYVSSYRLIYQVTQSEYIIYIITLLTNVLMYVSEIFVVRITKNIIAARICVTCFQLVNSFLIGVIAKKRYKFLNFRIDYSGICISGTKDVFVSKICGLMFSSASVLFISTFVGTAFTSVYAVYESTLSVISSAINAFLIAPRNALGLLLNEENNNRLKNVFNEYEFLASLVMSILYSVTYALIVPFVRMYTQGIADIDYIDSKLALLLVLNAVFQMIHIPSGTCLEVAGQFKAIKKIQGIAATLIICFSVVGAINGGLYGILFAKLITSFFLCIAEIMYTRKHSLSSNLFEYIKVNIPSFAVTIVASIAEYNILFKQSINILQFLGLGFLLLFINSLAVIGVNIVFNKRYLLASFNRVRLLHNRE